MTMPPPPSYIGLIPSLYSSLDAASVAHLERALWIKMSGRYEDALSVFNNELLAVRDVPIVLIELASLYFTAFRYRDLCELLEPRLAAAGWSADQFDAASAEPEAEQLNATLDAPEWRLLALLYAATAIRCRGVLAPASQELHRTRLWLANVPVAEYTELQAVCVTRYVILFLFTVLQSSLADGRFDDIPRPERRGDTSTSSTSGAGSSAEAEGAPATPWLGLTDLRRSLFDRREFNLAHAVFRVELNRIAIAIRVSFLDEYLQRLQLVDGVPHRAYKEAEVRDMYSQTLIELHQVHAAETQSQAAERALDQWCLEVQVDSHHLPLSMLIELHRLSLMADQEEKFLAAMQLSGRMEQVSHPKLYSVLDTAAETATKAEEVTGCQDYRAQCYDIREKQERIDEINGDLCDIVGHSYEMHSYAQHSVVDARKALEWIDGFFAKYPDFGAPRAMESLHRRRAMLLFTLRDVDAARQANAEADDWRRLMGDFRHLNLSRSNIIAPGDGAVGAAPYDEEEDDDSGQSEEFYTGWSAIDESLKTQVLMRTMVEFALSDVRGGLLTDGRVQELFGVSGSELEAKSQRGDADWFKKLWLPQADDDSSHVGRYDGVWTWLQTLVRGSRDRRLTCLVRFLERRKEWATEAGFTDLQIRDGHRLVELYDLLPRMLHTFFASWQWAWHATIAWGNFMKFLKGGQWTLFDNAAYLVQVEKHGEMAMHGYRKTHQPRALANIERLLAQVCLISMRRRVVYRTLAAVQTKGDFEERVFGLLQSQLGALEDVEASLVELRTTGLRYLAEAEQINSTAEREACWDDGLEGIRKRTAVAEMNQSHLTTRYAIRTWMEGAASLTDEARCAIWKLTQNHKARLLATAIGMFRSSPPGLVQRILGSEDEGAIYQRTLDLQRQIDEADEKDRFFLRRRLDAERQKMKEYPLLRQLITLREGTPLSLDDVGELSGHGEEGVVLVDWMYLDGFFDCGKMLLVTARAGAVPTVDEVHVNEQAVRDWKAEHLDSTQWHRADTPGPSLARPHTRASFNAICGGLVAPLASRTQADDTLVLCPTDFLSGLPLHGLDVDGDALIRRNPCVYSHSHSLLRSCLVVTRHAADARAPLNPTFISGIAGADFAAGRASVVDMAAQMSGAALTQHDARKAAVLARVKHSRLVHLHTHCAWDAQDPLQHRIEFPHGDVLTAREAFEVRFGVGVHVNVVACEAGRTEVRAGDEVMGLVPAFLYSGAASVVSTLWPIRDGAGAAFSRRFFDAWVGMGGGGGDGDGTAWVHVAKAVQRAVVGLDPYQNAGLLHWAGFVMHGYWMFPVSGEGGGV